MSETNATVEFIEKIIDLAKPNEIILADGRHYCDKVLRQPLPSALPSTVSIHTLQGVVDLHTFEVLNDATRPPMMVQVCDEKTVVMQSSAFGEFKQRDVAAKSDALVNRFGFGQWMDCETFIISMMTQFVQSEATAKLLSIVGNISDANVREFSDDGVTQNVTVKAGVAKKADVSLPNPIPLRPYRTFMEIEQPESLFVFRMKSSGGDKPLCALYEADGAQWKLTAIDSIKAWFKANLAAVPVVG